MQSNPPPPAKWGAKRHITKGGRSLPTHNVGAGGDQRTPLAPTKWGRRQTPLGPRGAPRPPLSLAQRGRVGWGLRSKARIPVGGCTWGAWGGADNRMRDVLFYEFSTLEVKWVLKLLESSFFHHPVCASPQSGDAHTRWRQISPSGVAKRPPQLSTAPHLVPFGFPPPQSGGAGRSAPPPRGWTPLKEGGMGLPLRGDLGSTPHQRQREGGCVDAWDLFWWMYYDIR